MAALVHFGRRDATQRTTTSTSAVEVTQHTVNWSDLTGAGFANGDEVLILVRAALNIDSANGLLTYAAGRGTTFAGRTQWADSVSTIEGQSTTATRGHHYGWFHKHTLVTDENIYFALTAVGGTNTARVTDFSVVVLKLTGLGADDYKYNEQTDSGDAPTSYDTTGATVTLPGSANSDWLVLSCVHWLIDSTSADLLHALSDGGSDVGELQWEGEDVAEERNTLVSRYIADVASDRVERTRFRTDTATTHDVDMTKVFALRLDAFVDHSGVQSTSTITHTATATYQEAAGVPSHPVTATGDHLIFAESVSDSYQEATKNPFSRIQVGGSDWPEAGMGDGGGAYGHGAADKHGVCQFGIASLNSGTADIDWDLQEGVDVTPNYSHSYHTLVAISMELAAGGTTFNQSVTATSTATSTMVRSSGKLVNASGTGTPTMIRQAGKAMSAASSAAASTLKSVGKALAASGAGTATLSSSLIFARTLSAVATGTATVVRQAGKLMSASSTTATTMVRSAGKLVSASVTGTASMVRSVGKILATITATGTATIEKGLQFIVTMTAAGTGTAAMVRQAGKVLAAVSTASATTQKACAKALSASSVAAASMLKQATKTLAAGGTGTATLVKGLAFGMTMTVTASGLPTVVRQIEKLVSASGTGAGSMQRAVGKTLVATATASSTLLKAVGKILAVVANGLTTLGTLFIPGGGGGVTLTGIGTVRSMATVRTAVATRKT